MKRLLIAMCMVALLMSCDGGGGSSSSPAPIYIPPPPPPPPPPDIAPVINLSESWIYPEPTSPGTPIYVDIAACDTQANIDQVCIQWYDSSLVPIGLALCNNLQTSTLTCDVWTFIILGDCVIGSWFLEVWFIDTTGLSSNAAWFPQTCTF